MLRTLLIILLLIPTLAAHASDDHKPQLYDYEGNPVDPLCFLSNIGTEDKPIIPTRFCKFEEIVNVGQSPVESPFVGASFEEEFYDAETDERFSSHGFIAYRAIGMVEYKGRDLMAVWQMENAGGSGTFSSLQLYDPVRDEEEQTLNFHHVETIAYGDRCMGGIAEAKVDPENKDLIFRVHTTMGDMFRFVGDEEREILKSDLYNRLPYCALCCYAQAEHSLEEFRGMFFPAERHKPDADNEAGGCVEELVELNVTQAQQDYFGKEDFGFFISELEHVCLGRIEGEESF